MSRLLLGVPLHNAKTIYRVPFTDDTTPELLDLFRQIFERDPAKRITMDQLRVCDHR